MRVLVTGASGFLGRHVVSSLGARGHAVRALVRPASRVDGPGWSDRVEVVRADLRAPGDLSAPLRDVDVVVHLAAAVTGGEDAQFAAGVVGTERLMAALPGSTVRRVVLASSFSVYDWTTASGTLDESSPVVEAPRLYERDGYAVAKVWQERVTRQWAAGASWQLTVLRPGFIWGRDHGYLACLGEAAGRIHLTLGPRTRLPLTHVENCADLFSLVVDHPGAAGETFNVVDGDDVRAWRYLGDHVEGTGSRWIRVPVPYLVARFGVEVAHRASRWIYGETAKLPSILVPCRFVARFKPLRFSNAKLRDRLGWSPPIDYETCLSRTYG